MNAERWHLPVLGALSTLELKTEHEVKEAHQLEMERAYQESKKKGFEQGLKEAEAALTLEKEKVLNVMDTFHKALNLANEHLVTKLYGLIATAVHRTFENAISVDEDFIKKLVENELNHLPQELFPLEIFVSEHDFSLFKNDERFQNQNIQLKTDRHVHPGSFKINTPTGVIDGSLKTRLQQLTAVLCGVSERELKSISVEHTRNSPSESSAIPADEKNRKGSGDLRHGDEGEWVSITTWDAL